MLSSTVIEIIVEKLFQPRTRKEKYEDKAKQGLVYLHQALCKYDIAYRTFLVEGEDLNYNEWLRVTDWLDHVWNGMGPVIAVFDTPLFQCIQNYLAKTKPAKTRAIGSGNNQGLLMSAIKEEQVNSDADFECAITRLRKLMKEQMTMGEIRRAVQLYERDLFWWRSRP